MTTASRIGESVLVIGYRRDRPEASFDKAFTRPTNGWSVRADNASITVDSPQE